MQLPYKPRFNYPYYIELVDDGTLALRGPVVVGDGRLDDEAERLVAALRAAGWTVTIERSKVLHITREAA